MNIGIMTFHWAANHGALLQTYALQKSLERLIPDCTAIVVDYKPTQYNMSIKRALHSRSFKAIKNNLKDIKKERILAPFRNTFPKTYRYYSTQQLINRPPNCDIFIAGSDQIWNEFYTMNGEGTRTSAYYLPFHPGAKHISYAASFGTIELRNEVEEYILPFLQKMEAISVREETGKTMLKKLGIDAHLVCDPSALLSAEEYRCLAQSCFSDKYIAKYFLRAESPEVKSAVKSIKKKHRVRDISLLPMELWLGGIDEAEFLITNSFHGMMAAIKLHTPFAVFPSHGSLSGMNDRFFTLLNLLELNDRIVCAENSVEEIQRRKIDWTRIDSIMAHYVIQSEQFLKDNCTLRKRKGPIVLYRNAECCGCTACVSICPKECIQMVPDGEGFLYPQVNSEKCINCGKCLNVCPIRVRPNTHEAQASKVFAARAKDEEIVNASSSGGVFSVLASSVLRKGGVVFGVAMSGDCHSAVYTLVENEEQLAALRGSKYIQSCKGFVFENVKNRLSAGQEVLFCGTPCDVHGLLNYLQQADTNCEKLILTDFICHGTPSPLVWEKYILSREKSAGSEVSIVDFRSKSAGWRRFSLSLIHKNGEKQRKTLENDPFLRGFHHDLYLRPSCYECAAKGKKRVSDITLADAWGIEHYCSDLDNDKGCSLVFVNSDKAKGLFEKIADQLHWAPVDIECVLQYNRAMIDSAPMNNKRAAFMAQFPKINNIEKLIAQYCQDPFILRLKKKIKRVIKGVKWNGNLRK